MLELLDVVVLAVSNGGGEPVPVTREPSAWSAFVGLVQNLAGTLTAFLVVAGIVWKVARPHVAKFVEAQRQTAEQLTGHGPQLAPGSEPKTVADYAKRTHELGLENAARMSGLRDRVEQEVLVARDARAKLADRLDELGADVDRLRQDLEQHKREHPATNVLLELLKHQRGGTVPSQEGGTS